MSTNAPPPLQPSEPLFGGFSRQSMRGFRANQAALQSRETELRQQMLLTLNAATLPADKQDDVLEQARKEAERAQLADLYARTNNPALARVLSDLPTVRLLKDDAGNIERTIGTFDWFWRNKEAGETLNEAGHLYAQSAFRPLTAVEHDRLREIQAVQQFAEMETGFFDEAAKLVGQMWEPALYAAGAGLAAGGSASAVSGPGSIVTGPGAFAFTSGAVYFAHTAEVEFGHKFNEIYEGLRGQGVDEAQARSRAITIAGGYALGAAALDTFAGGVIAKPFIRAGRRVLPFLQPRGIARDSGGAAIRNLLVGTASGFGAEVGTEGVQEVLGGLASNIAFERFPELQSSVGEIAEQAAEVMQRAAKGMAVIAPLGPMLHFASDASRAAEAQVRRQHFEMVAALRAKSRVTAPGAVQDVVDAAAVDSGAEQIHIAGPQLAEALAQANVTRSQLAQDLPAVAEQLREAERTGDDVTMTMGEFTAHVVPNTALFDAVKDHARYAENDMSAADAEAWLAEQDRNRASTAAKVAEASSRVADWDQQARAVEVEFEQQLAADKRIPDARRRTVSQLYRSWVETQAADHNMTPQEFQAAHGLRVTVSRQARPSSTLLDQAAQVATPEFRTFFGESKVVDDDGAPLRVFHGTTHNFTEFTRERGNVENDMGLGFYFTNSTADVGANYAGRGPDLTNRIQQRAEQIENEQEIDGDEAMAQAERELLGAGGNVIPVYLSLQNPVVVGGRNETMFEMELELDEDGNVIDETGTMVDLIVELRRLSEDPEIYDADIDPFVTALIDEGESVSASRLIEIYKASENYATNDTGALVSNELLRQAFENIGFDGIIDHTAERFQMAGVDADTAHYIAFQPEQIKSAVASRGTFDPNDPNILRQDGDEGPRGAYDPDVSEAFLLEDADATTVLHEMSHHFMRTMFATVRSGRASERVRANTLAVLEWFEVGEGDVDARLAAWDAMSIEEQRPHWESFSYNWESYLHQGRSPNSALEDAFRAFTRWFRNVYRWVRRVLNETYKREFKRDLPALTPEVTQVYDRLLAAEDAIHAAEAERAMTPLLREKPDGMTDEDWARYQTDGNNATEDAITKLARASLRAMRWVGNARGRLLKEVQRETRALRAQVEAEERVRLERERAYVARRALQKGESVEADGTVVPADVPKLNTEQTRGMFEREFPEVDWRKLRVTSPKGAHPNEVAELLGYSGDPVELLRDLVETPPIDEAVQQAADERMLREHSELTDPEFVERRVEEVLHNEHRGRVVAAELKFLSRITAPVRTMVRAARAHAREVVGALRLDDLRPSRHSHAETRHRRAAEDALGRGEHEQAAAHKRRELVEGQTTREVVRARDEIARARKLFRDLFKPDARLGKTRDVDFIAVGRALLARYGLAPGAQNENPDAHVRQLKENNPALFDKLQAVLARADEWQRETPRRIGQGPKTWRDLTVEEFRELHETVDALWSQSRDERVLQLEGERMAIEDAEAALLEQDGENPVVGIPLEPGARTTGEAIRDKGRSLLLLAARPEHWFFRKDGAKEGGAFTRFFWNPIRAAVNRFTVDKRAYTTRLAKMVQDLHPKLRRGKIEFKDSRGRVLHVFGRGNGQFGHAELIGALLHTGNQSNLRKLLVGYGWGTYDRETGALDTREWDRFVAKMISDGYITRDVMDFVQAAWDLNEELKPGAQQAHKRVTGFRFNEIEAIEITMPFGTYRGGYVPAKLSRDARSAGRIQDLQEIARDFRNQFASTGRGFAKDRVEDFAEPLSLDIDLLPSHVDDVLRFTHLQPVIHDVQKLAKRQAVQESLNATSPGAWNKMILPWLQRVANQSATKAGVSPDIDRFWRGVRSSAGMTMMMGNVVNAMQQFTGLFTAGLKVGPRYIFSAMFRVLGNRRQVYDEIAELSPGFMGERQRGQIFDSVERVNSLMTNKGRFNKARAWTKRHAYFLQTFTQNWIDAVVWQAAYEQSLDGADRATADADAKDAAVKAADAAVRTTQSSFDPTDVAGFEEQTPFVKLFTQFSGWFNSMANLQADQFVRMMRTQGFGSKVGVAMQTYLLGFAVPMIGAEIFAQWARGRLTDEDDDGTIADELLIDSVLLGHLRSAAAEVPVAGQALNSFVNWWDNKPWNDRMASTPAISLMERAGRGAIQAASDTLTPVEDAKDAAKRAKRAGRNVRDVMSLLGFVFGLPGGPVGSRAAVGVDMAADNIEPTSSFDAFRAFVTGTPSRESRQ